MKLYDATKERFNPTLVRLHHMERTRLGHRKSIVSIPHWCDCIDAQMLADTLAHYIVSIPHWCDCITKEELLLLASGMSFNPTLVRLHQPVVSNKTGQNQ